MGYYDNANPTLLAQVDVTAKTVLELGCGAGTFARAYRQRNPMCNYIGIEYVPAEAEAAKDHVDHILCGDVQTPECFEKLDAILAGAKVDLLIIGDVLEHLWEPQHVMEEFLARMAPTARAEICIPNIAHWSILMKLLKGDWTYEGHGLLDRTHMRFFTRDTTRKMYVDAGWHVRAERPRIFGKEKGMKHARAFAKLAPELGFDAKTAAENMLPLQWVHSLSATPPSAPIPVRAIGIGTKIDALSKIRLRQPLTAMTTAGLVAPNLKTGAYDKIPDGPPGVFLTYRLHPENEARKAQMDEKCKAGWIFVHDVDDHPAYLKGQKANDFWSIKAAHAVTVSTPALADVCRQWNPNVFVVENQIFETSDVTTISQQKGDKPRLFFGALNREEEWKAQCGSVVDFLIQHKDKIACDVVHEPSLHQALDGKADATFHPTQTYEGFIALLAQSDFALLPLFESEFNACKSDLKIIECLAHGVVPICSPYAAAQTPVSNDLLCVAEDADGWATMLTKLLENPNEVKARKAAGLAYVQKHRMWSGQAKNLAKLYQNLIADHKNLEAQRQARLPR